MKIASNEVKCLQGSPGRGKSTRNLSSPDPFERTVRIEVVKGGPFNVSLDVKEVNIYFVETPDVRTGGVPRQRSQFILIYTFEHSGL